MNAPGVAKPRLATVDGLRGIAALAVTLFHLREATHLAFPSWKPGFLDPLLGLGFLGVDVFFVLSGFVIAFGLTNRHVSPGFVGRFVLRRSLRLDPPYWLAIGLEILAVTLAARVGFGTGQLPDWRALGLHVLYAQELAGVGSILPIFWTLCFEIQFYVVLVGAFGLYQYLKKFPAEWVHKALLLLGALSVVLSILTRFTLFGVPVIPGLALIRWYQFFLGACTWWVASQRLPLWPLLLGWGLVLSGAMVNGSAGLELAALLTSLVLLVSYRRDHMQSWLSGRWLLYLGSISYSLYLYHSIFGWRSVRVLGVMAKPEWAWALNGYTAIIAGLAASIGSAAVLYYVAERPSLQLGKRIRL